MECLSRWIPHCETAGFCSSLWFAGRSLVAFGLPDRPVVISLPCGILWSFIVLLPSLSCGLICSLLCKSMMLVAMQPCSQQTQQDSQNISRVKTCKGRILRGSFRLQSFIFISLGHFCNIITFLCVLACFGVFICVTRKLNAVSLKKQDLKEPK